jgi:hypothetical protein
MIQSNKETKDKMSGSLSHHRGAHPADHKLFGPPQHAMLRQTVSDLSWLLSRAYAPTASLKLVGDHYKLKERQRLAVARAACSDQQRERRQQSCLPMAAIAGQHLLLDGFNLIVTLEAALSGGVLLNCRDGCLRDMSSVHGSYRTVSETEQAIHLLSETLLAAQPAAATWLFDQPVSNSGRLAQRLREMALAHHWPWQVEVVLNPDKELCASDRLAVTSDSHILDHVRGWLNLPKVVIEERLPRAWIVDLRS